MIPGARCTLSSLYRTHLRQIKQLPLSYLRLFFRIKTSDDFRAIAGTTKEDLRNRKIRRVSRDLRKIEEAISGSTKAFAYVLDLAYGRKGKLKWEIMEPLLSDPKAPTPSKIIPSVEKSRPPVYSPELKALLTSSHARTTKPLTQKLLSFPRTLPPRADPASDDARLLGPFSKRREVNIRWRSFANEWKKVYPPLQLVANDASCGLHESVRNADLLRAGIRGFGMQDKGVFEDVLSIVGPLSMPNNFTKKERQTANIVSEPAAASHRARHPSRWIRRRFQALLGRLPVLTYSRHGTNKSGSYTVSLSPSAIANSLQGTVVRLAEMKSVDDREWLALAQRQERKKNQG